MTRYLPFVLIVPGYGPTLPVFSAVPRQPCAGGTSTKKNTSLPWPSFQTWRSGSQAAPPDAAEKSVLPPRMAVMLPVATMAFFGQPLSVVAAVILPTLHVGKSLPSDFSP